MRWLRQGDGNRFDQFRAHKAISKKLSVPPRSTEDIVPIGLRRMLADVTALMAEMGIETRVNAAEDADVIEEE
ncbi:TPA: hypothetical protein ACH3X3_013235 [Trebouxia sp. C0006]